MRVATFQVEAKLTARDAGEIEQIIDQACLQFHVAHYYSYILYEFRRKFWRIVFQVGRRRECWR